MVNLRVLISCALSVVTIAAVVFFSGGCSGKTGRGITDNNDNTEEVDTVKLPLVEKERVNVTDTLNLRIYYPNYTKVDLITDEMPSKNDTTVIMVAEAAFTAGTSEEIAQGPIAGDHVLGGVRKKGYVCKRNNGAFVYYNGKPKFLHEEYSNELDSAANNGGCGFAQEMMLHNGEIVSHTRHDDNVNEFRALCLVNGKLAIADSKGSVKFGDFINDLQKAGATEALYLDMGSGWNYSWYRNNSGYPVNIHPESEIGTNWITFYN